MVFGVVMDNRKNEECLGNRENDDIVVVRQTSADYCEKVCNLNNQHTILVNDGEKDNGAATVQGTSSTEVKPPVIAESTENGPTVEPNYTVVMNNGISGDVVNYSTAPDTIVTQQSQICSVREDDHFHHVNGSNSESCMVTEKIPSSSINTELLENEHGNSQTKVPVHYRSSVCFPKNELRSEKSCTVSDKCTTSNDAFSEKDKEHESEVKDSAPSNATNIFPDSVEMNKSSFQMEVETEDQVSGNEHNKDMEYYESIKNTNKKTVQKDRTSSPEQQSLSMDCDYLTDNNNVVDDLLYVMNVVREDFEYLQLSLARSRFTHYKETSVKNNTEDDKLSKLSSTLSSDGESSSSSESSSEESDLERDNTFKNSKALRNLVEDYEDEERENDPPKTKNEVLLSELPPPSPVNVITDGDIEIKPLGEIESILSEDSVVILKSFPDVPAIDSESVLFLDDGSGFGQVFEIFGQVKNPHYCVRFNSSDEIRERNLSIGQTIYYAPNTEELTNFVFVSQLERMKGSDASWKFDQEPPAEVQTFSDDEAEAKAKAAKKRVNRLKKWQDVNMKMEGTSNMKKQCSQRTKNFQMSSNPQQNQTIEPQPCQTTSPQPLMSSWSGNHPTEFPQPHNCAFQINPRARMPRFGLQPAQRQPSRPQYRPPPPRNPYNQQPPGKQYMYNQQAPLRNPCNQPPPNITHNEQLLRYDPPPPPPPPPSDRYNQQPLPGDRYNQQPLPGDPYNQQPLPPGDPYNQQPLPPGDPYNLQPLPGDPYNLQPLLGDPYNQPPPPSNPYNQKPPSSSLYNQPPPNITHNEQLLRYESPPPPPSDPYNQQPLPPGDPYNQQPLPPGDPYNQQPLPGDPYTQPPPPSNPYNQKPPSSSLYNQPPPNITHNEQLLRYESSPPPPSDPYNQQPLPPGDPYNQQPLPPGDPYNQQPLPGDPYTQPPPPSNPYNQKPPSSSLYNQPPPNITHNEQLLRYESSPPPPSDPYNQQPLPPGDPYNQQPLPGDPYNQPPPPPPPSSNPYNQNPPSSSLYNQPPSNITHNEQLPQYNAPPPPPSDSYNQQAFLGDPYNQPPPPPPPPSNWYNQKPPSSNVYNQPPPPPPPSNPYSQPQVHQYSSQVPQPFHLPLPPLISPDNTGENLAIPKQLSLTPASQFKPTNY